MRLRAIPKWDSLAKAFFCAPRRREGYMRSTSEEPILDYHCQPPAKDIADNHRFRDLTEIWLKGDHYKWRPPCVPKAFQSGTAPVTLNLLRKFLACARTFELKRCFGIDKLPDENSAGTG
jgi:glucuronate isomerase